MLCCLDIIKLALIWTPVWRPWAWATGGGWAIKWGGVTHIFLSSNPLIVSICQGIAAASSAHTRGEGGGTCYAADSARPRGGSNFPNNQTGGKTKLQPGEYKKGGQLSKRPTRRRQQGNPAFHGVPTSKRGEGDR